MCLDQFIGENWGLVITISLTLAALGFSIFSSIYSNLIHDAEMAEGNMLQCDKTSDYWRKAARNFRELARSRAITANLCYWSLLLLIITLVFLLVTRDFYFVIFVIFVIALSLLVVALISAGFLIGYKRPHELGTKKRETVIKRSLKFVRWLLRRVLWRILWPVNPNVPRLTDDC